MKLRNLLVLGALLLVGSAQAAIVERQKPVFTPNPIEAITDGTTSMYMYNVGAGKFFCGGNNWGTRTSIGDEGYRVYFEQYVPEGVEAWDGTTVIFKDSCLAKSGAIHTVFFDNVNGGCFVDKGSQANFYWKLQKNADNAYYRLSMAECNPDYQAWQVDTHPNTFWGWASDRPGDEGNGGTMDYTTVYSFLDPTLPANHVDWAIVSVADYLVYEAQLDVYGIAQNLKAAIEEAAAKGIDVAAFETVYNNGVATAEELEAAIVDVKKAMAKLEETTVDPANPVDKTSAITNPSYDNNDNTGWSGTKPGFQSFTDAEHYNKTFDSWQMLTDIPNGVYKLTIQGFYRPATAGATGAVFYAAGADSVTTNVPDINSAGLESTPNNMESAANAFKQGAYATSVYFIVTENKARIGVAMPKTTGGSDWVIWDNWSLSYYGNSEASFAALGASLTEEFAAKYEDAADEFLTAGMLETAQAAISAVAVKDYASYKELVAVVDAETPKLDANLAAWTEYKNLFTEADNLTSDNDIDQESQYMADVAIYVMIDGLDIFESMELATEPLLAEIEKLAKLVDDAKKKALKDNADVTTKFLVNADYSQGTTGWSGSWTQVQSGCMEAYERDWDAYQIAKGAPQGVYEVSLQGFYRVARGNDAFNMWQSGQQTCPGHVYVNNNQTPVPCVFSEPVKLTENIYSGTTDGPEGNFCAFEDPAAPGDTLVFPNDMKSAGEAFAMGMFKATANGVVAKDGEDLRLGVKGKKQTATWVIWDNFKMVYRGKQIEYVLPHLTEAIATAATNLELNMDATTKAALAKAKADGEKMLTSTDEDKVFQALVDLYALNDSVASSVELYETLLDKAEALYEDIALSQAAQDVITAAGTFAENIQAGVAAGTITKAQAETYLAECALWKIKLRLPDVTGASVDNPIEVTNVLINPDFGDAIGTNTIDGWDGTSGYNFGNDDTQKGALALEFYEKTFDMSQTVIGGLPNGAYRVEVNAFGRLGSTADDFAAARDTMPATRAIIYAMSSTDSTTYQQVPVKLLSEAATTENLSSGSTTITDEAGNTLYFPNDMVSAGAWFAAGYNKHELMVEVKDNTLKIGIKKAESAGAHWVIMDNWKLFYLGADGTIGIEDVVAGGEVVSVAVYNANGVQLNGIQKGINIIRTVYSNGAVTVKKVIK